jgi:hypothetical protein
MLSELLIGLAALAGVFGLAALVLHLRDRIARAQGKAPEQMRARLQAILQFRKTLQLCIPGVLIIIFGVFWVIDRASDHESDWWQGLFAIPVGWAMVPLLAKRSWRRYLELQRQAENPATHPYDQIGPPPSGQS